MAHIAPVVHWGVCMRLHLAIATTLMAVCWPTLAVQPAYQLTVIQPEGAVYAEGISKKNWLAASNDGRGLICSPELVCSPVPPLDGALYVYTGAISSDAKFLAGTAIFDGEVAHAALVDVDGSRTLDLGVLPDPKCPSCTPRTSAGKVNSAGQVIGIASHKTFITHSHYNASATRGFVWQAGVMTDIGTLGGSEAGPSAINERGHVVGHSRTGDGTWAPFIYRNGKMEPLPLPEGATEGFASDINDHGLVLMQATVGGIARQYIYLNGARLEIQLPAPFDNRPSLARINNRGMMLGDYFDTRAALRHPFLFDGTDAFDLNDCLNAETRAKYELIYAYDFNDQGRIIAAARDRVRQNTLAVVLAPQ
jgi:probable HAF family extracellular repeat protein